MNKVFCSCGAIEDLDSTIIDVKMALGKEIECSRCRNRRIAMELEELGERFSESEGEDYLYH